MHKTRYHISRFNHSLHIKYEEYRIDYTLAYSIVVRHCLASFFLARLGNKLVQAYVYAVVITASLCKLSQTVFTTSIIQKEILLTLCITH